MEDEGKNVSNRNQAVDRSPVNNLAEKHVRDFDQFIF